MTARGCVVWIYVGGLVLSAVVGIYGMVHVAHPTEVLSDLAVPVGSLYASVLGLITPAIFRADAGPLQTADRGQLSFAVVISVAINIAAVGLIGSWAFLSDATLKAIQFDWWLPKIPQVATPCVAGVLVMLSYLFKRDK